MEQVSCGICLIDGEGKFLVCHSSGFNSELWGFPKGHKEDEESDMDAAYREFNEECGIDLNTLAISEPEFMGMAKYKKINKRVYIYVCYTEKIIPVEEMSCSSYFIHEEHGLLKEIDEYCWLLFNELDKVYYAQREIINKWLDTVEDNTRLHYV